MMNNHFNYRMTGKKSFSDDEDDDTYLRMDQYKDRDQESGLSVHLDNLMLQNINNRRLSGSVPMTTHFRKSGAYPEFHPPPPIKDRGNLNPSMSGPHTSPRGKSPTVPNYTKWNPNTRKGNPSGPVGTPGYRNQRPPIPTPDEGPASDDPNGCYLTFDETAVTGPPYPSHPPVIPRPNNSRKPEAPPPLQPRSPLSPPGLSDHGYPSKQDDFLPGRPPPAPPSSSPHGGWSLPSPIGSTSRSGSGKDSHGSNSPYPSRESSLKDMHGHVPSRDNSTGSSDSSGDAGRPQPPSSSQAFAKFNKPGAAFPKPAKPGTGFAMPPMPSFKQGIESQAWFKDWNRQQSEQRLKQHNERGAFLVRPRKESNTKPYALTVWANNKCYNFLIRKRSDGEYALGTEKPNERTFSTPMKLIEYHMEYEVVLAEGEGSVLLVGPPK